MIKNVSNNKHQINFPIGLLILLVLIVPILSTIGCSRQVMYSKRLYEPMNFSVRKVMYSMKYLFTSDQPDSIHIKIVQIAKKYNGYIVEQTNDMTTIRIPSKNQIEALTTIEGMGKVSKKELSGKDVTEEYEDLNIKLETLEKARKRYLELLDKAEDVKATLEVEKELERVNKEIDLLKGKLTNMTHLIEYITIEVRTEKTVRPGPLGWIFYGVYKGIAWLFVWE